MLFNSGKAAVKKLFNSNQNILVVIGNKCKMSSTTDALLQFKTLAVKQPKPFVYHVELNRPDKLNALNKIMWTEIKQCFNALNENPDCRAIVLSAAGKHFTAGLDLMDALSLTEEMGTVDDVARRGRIIGKSLRSYQESVSSLENCLKPVISTVHSACVGAGVDLITAADIRYCSKDAWFTVKEVEIGMAADVGTLQRFPKVVKNQSVVRELCLTGRKFDSTEALDIGLVSRVFALKEEMINEAIQLAALIASKSPIAVQGTKKNLVYSLNHSTQDGLDQIYEMNQLLLQSEDFAKACMAQLSKGDPPVFSKL